MKACGTKLALNTSILSIEGAKKDESILSIEGAKHRA
jgi:hypothetical protein